VSVAEVVNKVSTHPNRGVDQRSKGFIMVLVAATLWGVSGSVAQVLFHQYGIEAGWLVTVRMTMSGLLLLACAVYGSGPRHVISIWKNRRDAWGVILFAFLGLIGVQYTYFASIQYGNAAAATILQYIAPVFVALYLALRYRRPPNAFEVVSTVLAVGGTFLLITDGHWTSLSISPKAAIWGIVSAVALAFYTLYPGELLRRYGSATVIGWAMFIGGIEMSVVTRPWVIHTSMSLLTVGLISFVVIFGTLIPFYLYLASLRYMSGQETSVIACAEPLSAAIVGVLFLHVQFGAIAMAGGSCILLSMMILAKKGQTR
jgi:drug/metabolite transporter (DMT)-like permease